MTAEDEERPEEVRLSTRQAYEAMYGFLDAMYDRTKADYLGMLLGGMSTLADGGTADPAVWGEWEEAVETVLTTGVNTRLQIKRDS